MSLVKISQMTSLATATDAAIMPVVESGTNKKLTLAALKSYAVDYPITNQFYIDPKRTDSYTATGNPNKPFKTMNACYTYIKALITAGTIAPAETNPIFMILMGSITEDITLDTGHIFLVGDNATIHAPIYIFGTITISGASTGSGALDANHFSLQGIAVNAPSQKACIYFTGSNAQRLMVKDLWLTATGAQTGTTPFVDAGGYGIYADCTGYRSSDSHNSSIHGDSVKVSHNGSGDVYCFKIGANAGTSRVSADFSNVETSGATQVGAVGTGCLLAFTTSQLDANGDVCIEAYGTGVLSVANSSITNASTGDSYGVWLHSAGGAALITNTIIDVASSTSASRMIHGVSGTALFYKNIMIGRATTYPFTEHNKKIDSAITAVQITTDSFTSV